MASPTADKVPQPSLVLGIVGGIGSGKSLVAKYLASLGASVFSADQAGHEALKVECVKAALRQRWGAAVFTADGKVDRSALAELVFQGAASEQNRAFLEGLVHPRIDSAMQEFVVKMQAAADFSVAVVDAALLLEAGWDRQCDRVLFVDSPLHDRLERCRGRGWTEKQFHDREATQLSIEEKRRRADWIVVNDAEPSQLQRQVQELLVADGWDVPFSPTQGLNLEREIGDNDA